MIGVDNDNRAEELPDITPGPNVISGAPIDLGTAWPATPTIPEPPHPTITTTTITTTTPTATTTEPIPSRSSATTPLETPRADPTSERRTRRLNARRKQFKLEQFNF